MRILAREERRAAGGMMVDWGVVMECLDATLSLAVAFCLLGGLFWLVRSPHPALVGFRLTLQHETIVRHMARLDALPAA